MDSELEKCRELVLKITKARAVNKRKITIILTKLKELKANNSLTKDIFVKQNVIISDILNLIKISDDKIVNLFEEHNVEILDPDGFEKDIESQVSYHFN